MIHTATPGLSPDTVAARLAVAREALQAAYGLIRNETEDAVAPGEVLNQVRTAQDLVDLAHSIQTHRLAEHAGTVTHHDPLRLQDSAARGSVSAADQVDPRRFADLSAMLQWGPRTAARRCRESVTAVVEFPCLVDALADGEIDRERLAAVVDATHDLSDDDRHTAAPLVEQAMLDGSGGGIGSWTPTTTRQRARAAVADVDAMTPIRLRRRSIREAVGVTFAPGRVRGTSVLTATLTTEQAMTTRAAIERLAWTYRTAGDEHGGAGRADRTTLGECRAEALVDLMTANAQVSASATFLIPVNTGQQVIHERALRALTPLLTAHGLQLALAPSGEDPPPGWQTRPDDPAATPEDLAALCRGEPSERAALDGAVDPAALPPWTPADGSLRSTDPDTVRATTMAQIADQLSELGRPRDWPAESAPPGSVLRGLLEPDDERVWRSGHPGDVHVAGVGVIGAETVTGLISACGTDIGRALVDPRTGAVREHSVLTYRPPARMKRLVQVRDQTCRFPGCARPAQFTDLDHATPYAAGGATTAANLISLCRAHHRAKGSGAWRVTLHDDDSVTWTTIGGRQCTSWPGTEPAPF